MERGREIERYRETEYQRKRERERERERDKRERGTDRERQQNTQRDISYGRSFKIRIWCPSYFAPEWTIVSYRNDALI